MAVSMDTVTLTANTVATVDLTGPGNKVGVVILDNAARIHFNVSTTGTPAADPTVDGDDLHALPNSIGAFKVARGTASGATTRVKLISPGTPIVCVELIGD